MLKLLALYFGFTPTQYGDRSTRLEYGFTAWDRGGDGNSIRLDLVAAKSGGAAIAAPPELIASFAAENVGAEDEGELITDDLDFVAQFVKFSERDRHFKKSTVSRADSAAVQVIKFGSMLNRDRFFVPTELLAKHDLIFPESSLENLIDQQISDDQKAFPLTQSLLIACHAIEKRHTRRLGISSISPNRPIGRLYG